MVQALPSVHAVPAGAGASAGHAADWPVQASAASHTAIAARHSVPAGLKTSPGHAALWPVQVSSRSHAPAADRHTVPAGLNVHIVEQHDHGLPLAAPSSQASLAFLIPLPQAPACLGVHAA